MTQRRIGLKVLGLSFLLAMGLGLGLLAVEAVLRFWDPIGISYVPEARRYFKLMSKHPIYAYIHRPNLDMELQDVRVTTNSEGFRGAEFKSLEEKGSPRIALLGDSFVFSWGVEEPSMLSTLLTSELAERGLTKAEVLPLGVGSWNTRTQYEYMKERGFDFQPDTIVLLVVQNDLEPKPRGRTLLPLEELRAPPPGTERPWDTLFLEQRKFLTEHSLLATWIERTLTASGLYRKNLAFTEPSSPQARDAMDALTRLIGEANNRGIELIVFLDGEGKNDVEKRYQKLYSDRLTELGITPHYFPAETYIPENRNSLIDPHPNAHGLEIMAKTMAEVIATR